MVCYVPFLLDEVRSNSVFAVCIFRCFPQLFVSWGDVWRSAKNVQQLLSANEHDRSRGKVRVRHPNVDHNAATLSTSCLSRLNYICSSLDVRMLKMAENNHVGNGPEKR